ncbi:TUDOR-SN protein 1 [Prunus dulcis]|uniref:TUDOR-SN protein 1 n=1 Tax=Prunus dulcis TaxID=3755 RepID=A0A4Y1RUX0_PRUDU|nr:TUDOR-SN protein 1 [Prunus dulcis]
MSSRKSGIKVLLDTVDGDGYFIGTLLASNTHVAIPLLQAGLAKLEENFPKAYSTEFNNAQKYAREEKLKIWETYVETS